MPKTLILKLLLLTSLSAFLSPAICAQDCVPPQIIVNAKNYNIFSPEQEMFLGDLTYQKMSGEVRFIKDPKLLAYLNSIGGKLTKHLPPTGIKFKFLIVDIPEANAFNVPGGYILVTRKLIAFANNEDEIAGVMAHELGHGVVRHGASDFSELLKKVLNVTQVGDRKDIAEKYNLFIERQRTKDISRQSGESEHQLEADRVGLYAMIAAGYDPNAFASFFDRLAETKGKTGNWFTDIFGRPKPEQKRLREMIKISEQLPAQCRDKQAAASQEFLKWQADVVSYRDTHNNEELPGLLWKKELSPRLRSDISQLAFSPDGKHFLAQNDFAITVIQREPLQVLFQISAPQADDALFTRDGQFVVFGSESLRYEKWSIAEKKPVQIRELVVARDCWEHAFSPEGNYLVCVDKALGLSVLDTQTGKKIWEKKELYRLSVFELLNWILSENREDDPDRKRFFNIEFSPDSRFLIVSRTSRFRYSFRSSFVNEQSNDLLLALDMDTMKPIKTGGDLKTVTRRSFAFLDAERILGMGSEKPDDSGIFSFPDGKRLAKFQFGAEELERTANPNYVIVKPLANAKMGIFDLSRNAIVSGSEKVDAAIWENLLVYESISGKVLLSETHYDQTKKILQATPLTTVDIPVGLVGQLYAADISANLQWLAISTKSRGALWNLTTGERKLFVRGFRGVLLGNDGGGIGEFPKQEPLNHNLAFLNPITHEARSLREIPEKGSKQYGGFLLMRRPLKETAKKEKEPSEDQSPEASLAREVRFELRSVINDKVVWTRDFPKEAPRYFFDPYSGRLILYWALGSEVGKEALKDHPHLAARAKELANVDDDYVIEVVDAFAGKAVGMLLLDTGKHSFYIKWGVSEGNWLVLHDSQNRVLVYSLNDGELRHRFFGAKAAINPTRDQIVVENYPGQLTFYDLINGDSAAHLNFSGPTAFARFSLDGKTLFVLSGEQTAYAFDVDKLTSKSPSAQ